MPFLGFGKKSDQDVPTVDVSRVLKRRDTDDREAAATVADDTHPSDKQPADLDLNAPDPSQGFLLSIPPADTIEEATAEEPIMPSSRSEGSAHALRDLLKSTFDDAPGPSAEEAGADDVVDEAPTAAPVIAPTPTAAIAPDEAVKVPLVERLTPLVLWTSFIFVVGALIYGAVIGSVSPTVLVILGTGVFLFATLLMVAGFSRGYSPLLFTGILWRKTRGAGDRAATLAGGDILSALGLAETILDADPDARLVTTRDGVVVYANDAYMSIAREAGVVVATGLPPRPDRLFGQSRTESSKMFRLARAVRSGVAADEVITQTMGAKGAAAAVAPRRRFEVAVRPMQDGEGHMAWRLREVPIELARDTYRTAYLDYPRPVLALEKSGAIVWMNKTAAELIGVRLGAAVSLEDFVLGETKEIVAGLWEDNPEEIEGRVRARGQSSSAPVTVIFTAFGRGGIGEGFVCAEMLPKMGASTDQAPSDLAADVSDAPMGVAVVEGDVGSDAVLISANRMFSDAFGADRDMKLSETLPQAALRDMVAALRARSASQPLTRPVEVTIGEGASAHIYRMFCRPIKRRRGAYGQRQTVLYSVDVSYQKRMEEDYAHDKRLKAIGKIAGSVAHDFNNFLQAMTGATELLMRRHPAGDPSYPDLVSIRENAQRARNLTSNLLAFSRKQTLQSEILSVTELLADFTPFVQRYVTERVKVEVNHGRNLPCVKADKSQLELAIMNLAVNARDAMDKGGVLTISTSRVDAADVGAFGYEVLDDVDHVLIEVADNGTGVPDDIADKIFEPFFTTKGEGKGTGLGLSTVHGIIGQLGGRIFLKNRPGEGATFRIFLPAVSPAEMAEAKSVAKPEVKANASVDDLTGKGRILIVEDEDSVRGIVVRALAMCGYEITEASDGDEALDIIEEAETPFDVVLSDIMMPEMDGPTLIAEAGEKLRGAKVIFMSGYAETAMRDKLDTIQGSRYLQKPFTLKKVAATVKEAMSD